MSKARGFLEHAREDHPLRPVDERLQDWREVMQDMPPEKAQVQAKRCMDCGVPFCSSGCPLGNVIPDFNDLVFRDQWQHALEVLHDTNNFPEFTGLVCPAPCESACVLGIGDEPVTIKRIEYEIARYGWEKGWITPQPPSRRSGKQVAVVGSGPAGLAAAQQLARAGHAVTVFEREQHVGGLLRYGIPDFKLEKWLVTRRVEQMVAEGVTFETGVTVGRDVSASKLQADYDAVLLACGSEHPRDLPIEGRDLDGVHFAMDFLRQSNKRVSGQPFDGAPISAEGKRVVVIGGGDTGSDCIGTSHRQGALSVLNLELMEEPPATRDASTPWPLWPHMLRLSSSHEEGGDRAFAMMTTHFSGTDGRLEALHAVQVKFEQGRPVPIDGTEQVFPCDLVLLAMGYVHPVHDALISELSVDLDGRGNVRAAEGDYITSVPGVFAAGDCRRGQSLVVWAIAEGREVARQIDLFLMGESRLPRRDGYS
ncbi:MAG: glutamate synthase subunit beta [Bradymonadia bacterium]